MVNYSDFAYYGNTATPLIYNDSKSRPAKPVSRNAALLEITNNYVQTKVNKIALKPAEQLPVFSQLDTYSLAIPLPTNTLYKPDHCVYQTKPAGFWGSNNTVSSASSVKPAALLDSHGNAIVSGSTLSQLNAAKAKMLRFLTTYCFLSIKLEGRFFHANKAKITGQLDTIASFCRAQICVATCELNFAQGQFQPENSDSIYINIVGSESAVSAAEIRCNLLLDSCRGLFIDSFAVDLSLVNLVAGNSLDNFKNIIKQTGIFIYIPELLLPEPGASQVYLSGVQASVTQAKQMLAELLAKVQLGLLFKDIRVSSNKISYIVNNAKNQVNEIMYRNGSFVQFPLAGDLVRVQATSEHAVETTLKELCLLQTKVYELEVVGASAVDLALCACCNVMAFKAKSTYHLVGLHKDVLHCAKLVAEHQPELSFNKKLSSVTTNRPEVVYTVKIELLNAEKDFICGKKNGKLLKITNQTSTQIVFEAINEYSFLVEVTDLSIENLELGVKLLQLEFPSELSFYIPEIYHRQIIGIGGNVIQSIMRKYNVFIKFSNTFELEQNLISFRRYHNVLIKCPKKNESAIPKVKIELDALVLTCQDVSVLNFRLSVSQYRLFLNQFNGNKINEIEKKTNSFIDFPSQPPATVYDLVNLKAIDTKSSIEAFKLLSKQIPKETRLTVSGDVKFVDESNQEFVSQIVVPARVFLKLELKPVGVNQVLVTSYDMDSALAGLRPLLEKHNLHVISLAPVDFTYDLVDTKSKRKHNHSQSLNLHHPNQSYKQAMLKSPAAYKSGHFSPGSEIKKFSFPTPSQPASYHQPVSPVGMNFPNFPIIELNQKMQQQTGLLPAYDLNK